MNRIASILLHVPDEEMYAEVLQVILEVTESKHGVFGYINEDGAWVCPSLTRDVWDQCRIPDKTLVFPREVWGGMWGRAMTEKKTFCSNATLSTPKGHIPVHGALAVPIVYEGETTGLLMLGNKASDYDSRDKELLETIAGQVAPILHARLQRDAQKRARNLAEEALTKKGQELERSNAQLEQINAELTRIDLMKTEFLSNVSHELRTPLTAIRAYAETVLNQPSTPGEQTNSYMRIIIEQSDRLTSLIEDLLDLSKIEAGEVRLTLEPVHAEQAMRAAAGSMTPIAQKKHIDILVEPPGESYVLADEQRFTRILVNLLNNAVKFTDSDGWIRLSSLPVADSVGGTVPADVEPAYLRVTVSDNGMGIPPEELGKVFKRFKQVTDEAAGKPVGTGLGLTLSRELVERMGGRIWAESTVGKGSDFHFTLPLALETARKRNEPQTNTKQVVSETVHARAEK